MQSIPLCAFVWLLLAAATAFGEQPVDSFQREIGPLLKRRCVKCHGPAKQEGKLNLAAPNSIVRGGESGAAIVPHDADASLIWQRVAADEMPPENPLTADEKAVLKAWIVAGTPGLAREKAGDDTEHWSFRPLPAVLSVPRTDPSETGLDAFIAADLLRDGLVMSAQADRARLIRRVSFDLTGLPPSPDDIQQFQDDPHPDACERMVDRFLASPHFGERLGKVWLDAAGYADSNGYFNADSDRPLAYRYRDYVIRAMNEDRPYDQFLREQIAGDEIAGLNVRNGGSVETTHDVISLLEATHFLRCGQDGTGESDGNPDELTVDRYTVIETTMQNLSTSLLGLTIQCAKCHDHKFEPLTQRDYYQFQAVLVPAFPPENWVKPNDRFIQATLPGEVAAWEARLAEAESQVRQLSHDFNEWSRQHRPRGEVLFADNFDDVPESLAQRWSDTAPGDDAPAGTTAVNLNSRMPPSALVADGQLSLYEGGAGGDKWLSTRQAFDWTPDVPGASISVTFELISQRIGDSKPADRIGYLVALHDFNDNSAVPGGNLLIDGNPSGATTVYIDYPGDDSRQPGTIGSTRYAPGRNYGVRITNNGNGKFELVHLVDWQVDGKPLILEEADLPNGGFGFEFCCERSFVVDNVSIESFPPADGRDPMTAFRKQSEARRKPLKAARDRKAALEADRPSRVAWTTDLTTSPAVHILVRGNYKTPGEIVDPAGFSILRTPTDRVTRSTEPAAVGSGRRLQFANWITEPDSPREGLLARVHINRLWQHCFGVGIVATPDNFGVSGAAPSHPELLDWLAGSFVHSGWSAKSTLRRIMTSRAYLQVSVADEPRRKFDPDARRLSRFPVRRLDAEAIRDSLLSLSGELDETLYGPYVATTRTGSGETIVAENQPGAHRRSVYLQQKRTQVHSLLQVFDAPSIVFNSTRRARSTMPLQSLSQLNSEFVIARSQSLARRLKEGLASDSDRMRRLFVLTTGQQATDDDLASSLRFLSMSEGEADSTGREAAWSGLCQLLMISNAALYLD